MAPPAQANPPGSREDPRRSQPEPLPQGRAAHARPRQNRPPGEEAPHTPARRQAGPQHGPAPGPAGPGRPPIPRPCGGPPSHLPPSRPPRPGGGKSTSGVSSPAGQTSSSEGRWPAEALAGPLQLDEPGVALTHLAQAQGGVAIEGLI